MGTEIQELRTRIREEGRVAGLHGDGDYTDAALRRRRAQIVLVAAALVVGLTTLLVVDVSDVGNDVLSDVTVLRILLILLSAVMCAYVLDKERHLKRVEQLRAEEHAMNVALAESLLHSTVLTETERELTSVLDLGEVVDLALERMLDAVDAHDGVLMLRSPDRELRSASVRSHLIAWPTRVKLGEPVVARDIDSGEVVVASVPTASTPSEDVDGTGWRVGFEESAMVGEAVFVQLVHRGNFLGCVAVAPTDGEPFAPQDRELLADVATSAATAIHNAQRHEAALLQLDRTRSELTELMDLAR
ncbi:MAG: GAF domain-containing protein [Acidimicrobiia bacterium]